MAYGNNVRTCWRPPTFAKPRRGSTTYWHRRRPTHLSLITIRINAEITIITVWMKSVQITAVKPPSETNEYNGSAWTTCVDAAYHRQWRKRPAVLEQWQMHRDSSLVLAEETSHPNRDQRRSSWISRASRRDMLDKHGSVLLRNASSSIVAWWKPIS